MSAPSADGLPALKVAISASVSLALMILDFAWLMRDEVKFVWPRIRCSWYARFYVLSRYIGIISQIFNVYFTFRMYRGVRTSHAGCKVWFAYQAVIVQFLLVFAEGLLMHRIYALFLRSRMILLVLAMIAAGQVASMMISARFTLPNVRYADTCIILRTPPGNAYFGVTTMSTNIIIFFMTFCRYLRLPAKWTREGIGRVVLRDSAASVVAITVVMLFLTLSALRVIRPSMSGNVTYYWLVCVLWISIGRIVVNHEKLPREDKDGGSTWNSALQLTSQIELGEISQGSIVLPPPSKVPASRGSPQSSVCKGDMTWELPAVVEPAHLRIPVSEPPSTLSSPVTLVLPPLSSSA